MKIEIYHDILAKKIFDKVSADKKVLRKIERLVHERYTFFIDGKRHKSRLLSQNDLDNILPHLNAVKLSSEERAFIKKSRKVRRQSARLRGLAIATVLLVLGLLVFAVWQWNLANKSAEEAAKYASEAMKNEAIAREQEQKALINANTANQQRAIALEQSQLADSLRIVAEMRRLEAENSSRKFKGTAYAARSWQVYEKDPNIAFYLAYESLKIAETDESVEAIQGIISRRNTHFYQEIIQYPTGSYDPANHYAFSNDGRQFLFSDINNNNLQLYWGKDSSINLSGQQSIMQAADFSPNGQYCITGFDDKKAVIWNLLTMRSDTTQDLSAGVTAARFSPNSKQILLGTKDGAVSWGRLNGTVFPEKRGGQTRITALAIDSLSGDYLTGDAAGKLLLWSFNGNQPKKMLQGHRDAISALAFSRSGQLIVSGSKDKSVRLWSSEGDSLMDLRGYDQEITALAFSPDGNSILSGTMDGGIKHWTTEGRLLLEFRPHEEKIVSLNFSPDGRHFYSAAEDGVVKKWPANPTLVQGEWIAKGEVNAIAVSKEFILGGIARSNQAILLDYEGNLIRTLKGHTDHVYDVSFSPDGQKILTASEDHTARLWETRSGNQIGELSHSDAVYGVAFSPDGKRMATCSRDNTVKLWDANGQLLHTLKEHNGDVFSVVFSPDGRKVLTASADGKAILWDKNGRVISRLLGHVGAVHKAIFLPIEEGRVLTVGADHSVRIWNYNGREVNQFSGHQGEVYDVVYMPQTGRIITGGEDNTAIMWTKEGRRIQTFSQNSGDVISLGVHPEGAFVITGTENKLLRIWRPYDQVLSKRFIAPLTEQQKQMWNIDLEN